MSFICQPAACPGKAPSSNIIKTGIHVNVIFICFFLFWRGL
jgi:hypothetical protein